MAKNSAKEPVDLKVLLDSLGKEEYCYLTTIGRVSGKPHEIEIWFGLSDGKIYLLSGGKESSDWVKNLKVHPAVTVRIGKYTFDGQAQVVSEPQEDGLARRLLAGKYEGWQAGQAFSDWAGTALPVAIAIVT